MIEINLIPRETLLYFQVSQRLRLSPESLVDAIMVNRRLIEGINGDGNITAKDRIEVSLSKQMDLGEQGHTFMSADPDDDEEPDYSEARAYMEKGEKPETEWDLVDYLGRLIIEYPDKASLLMGEEVVKKYLLGNLNRFRFRGSEIEKIERHRTIRKASIAGVLWVIAFSALAIQRAQISRLLAEESPPPAVATASDPQSPTPPSAGARTTAPVSTVISSGPTPDNPAPTSSASVNTPPALPVLPPSGEAPVNSRSQPSQEPAEGGGDLGELGGMFDRFEENLRRLQDGQLRDIQAALEAKRAEARAALRAQYRTELEQRSAELDALREQLARDEVLLARWEAYEGSEQERRAVNLERGRRIIDRRRVRIDEIRTEMSVYERALATEDSELETTLRQLGDSPTDVHLRRLLENLQTPLGADEKRRSR